MAGSTLLISDIHADAAALDRILDLAFSESFSGRYGPVEKVLNLGDVMERGHSPKETVDRLRSLKNLESILGNHDEAFLQQKSLSGSDMASISAHEEYRKTGEYESFFKDMGLCYVDREQKLYAVHGGPLDPGVIAGGVPETGRLAVLADLATHIRSGVQVPGLQRLPLSAGGRLRVDGSPVRRPGLRDRLRARAPGGGVREEHRASRERAGAYEPEHGQARTAGMWKKSGFPSRIAPAIWCGSASRGRKATRACPASGTTISACFPGSKSAVPAQLQGGLGRRTIGSSKGRGRWRDHCTKASRRATTSLTWSGCTCSPNASQLRNTRTCSSFA